MRLWLLALWAFVTIMPYQAFATPFFENNEKPFEETMPQRLRQWKSWVLFGWEQETCPGKFNDKTNKICAFPSQLDFQADSAKATFKQNWLVKAPTWLALPGNNGVFPLKVKINGHTVPVLNKNGYPMIKAQPGSHEVTGIFKWDEIPVMISIPQNTGIIRLTIKGQEKNFPLLDKKGRLWLKKATTTKKQEDRLDIRISRLVTDSIPMTVTTHLSLDIAGSQREINLEDILLPNTLAMGLKSDLGARIDEKQNLIIQAQPGRWNIFYKARFKGPINKLGPVKKDYGPEFWAFKSQNQLRIVKISGVNAIDPGQADLPKAWKKYPVYLINPQNVLSLKTLQRGDPKTTPDNLSIKRTFWLDFTGEGFTIQDRITGQMTNSQRLVMRKPAVLGRVSVSGQDRLITRLTQNQPPGLELRAGSLNLVAESTLKRNDTPIPLVGWEHDFQRASIELNLPCGWHLLGSKGVDTVSSSYIKKWSLLDLFIVVIIALAVFKLFNWKWAIIALLAVGLSYHEPNAPQLTWLFLLLVLGLLKVLPQGRFYTFFNFIRYIALAILLLVSIPFLVTQARVGLYPQLEKVHSYWPEIASTIQGYMAPQQMDEAQRALPAPTAPSPKKMAKYRPRPKMAAQAQYLKQKTSGTYQVQRKLLTHDPNALVQTGPGLPKWSWRKIRLSWTGPCDRNETIKLYLLSPTVNLFLAWLRVILIATLLIGLNIPKEKYPKVLKKIGLAVILAFVVISPQTVKAQEKPTDYPPRELLKEYQARLLRPADCYPDCASISEMEINVTENNVTIFLTANAAIETALPIPGGKDAWQANSILLNDDRAPGVMTDYQGQMWVLVPKGVHRLVLQGAIQDANQIRIPFPLKPSFLKISAPLWDIQGLDKKGQIGPNILLSRQGGPKEQTGEKRFQIPFFLHMEKRLILGLNWQVETIVRRITPLGEPIIVLTDLLPQESVTTAGIKVENNKALLNFRPHQKELRFVSSLKKSSEITLSASKNDFWVETWILNASPIWHCDITGIPMVAQRDAKGKWQPKWQPWPNESVKIIITRPKAIEGQTITIDQAKLKLRPGQRFDEAELFLDLRSSTGGQKTITLPKDAKLQSVKIKGKIQPIEIKDGKVTLPIEPNRQTVFLKWRTKSNSQFHITTPKVNLGSQAVNAQVSLDLPKDRWILWAKGPVLGPAVLFWSYLLVICLAALFLGRIKFTPLKTRDWFLLGLGLTQVPAATALIIVAWLIFLGLRREKPPKQNWLIFNVTQISLFFWTIGALYGLYEAIEKGLLGICDMEISGNGSTQTHLIWTMDKVRDFLPQPEVFTVPGIIFNGLMLAWALWLAYSLLGWLSWGYESFGKNGYWYKWQSKSKKQEQNINQV